MHHKEGNEISFLGFSFGAVIAFIASSSLKNIQHQYLCSLSSYFAEDLPYIPAYWKKIVGKKRIEYFKTLFFSKLAKNNITKSYIFYGEKEHLSVKKRADSSGMLLKNSKVIEISNAIHDIGSLEYIEGVKKFFI